MAWIESHQELGHHPKTLALAAVLKCNLPAAIGYLHLLWYWALDYAQDGLIYREKQLLAARACEWHAHPDRFWAGLLQARFVDVVEQPCGAFVIHDWYDYAGKLKEQRALRRASNRRAQSERRQRLRNADSATSQQTVSAESASSQRLVNESQQSTVQYTTVQNTTGHSPPVPPPPRQRLRADDGCCALFAVSGGERHSQDCPVAEQYRQAFGETPERRETHA